MMVRVIYRDQTAGVVESHLLEELIRKGRIVAYHGKDRWIPIDAKGSGGERVVSGVTDRVVSLRRHNAH
jgi:hypothetical protein